MLPAFTCARALGNLWTISLGVNILRPSPYFALCLVPDAIEQYSFNNSIIASFDS